MEHIIVSETDIFTVLTAEEGFYLTTYKSEEPIEKYSSLIIAYLPKGADYSSYYAVTAEQNDEYEKQKREMMEK